MALRTTEGLDESHELMWNICQRGRSQMSNDITVNKQHPSHDAHDLLFVLRLEKPDIGVLDDVDH